MVNWFDLMRQAQGGSGLDNLARQFNLSSQQTNATLAALMPAFAMGFQNAASDPMAMGRLMQATMRGPYAAFFESATQAFTPQARREGEQVLDQLFGSDDVSRRVARQAASFSGVGVDVMQQMLPLIAGIVAGGLARVAQSQGAAIRGAMQSMQEQAPPQPSGMAAAGPWADLYATWLSLATGSAKPDEASRERPERKDNPEPGQPPQRLDATGKGFEDMMTSFLNPPPTPKKASKRASPDAAAERKASAQPETGEANPFQAWGEMMEKGHEMQRQHLASLQTILDGVWGKGGKP